MFKRVQAFVNKSKKRTKKKESFLEEDKENFRCFYVATR